MSATVPAFCAVARQRRLRGTFDYAAIPDRARMPWRFLARRMAVDGLAAG
jgi:hypothetical protein